MKNLVVRLRRFNNEYIVALLLGFSILAFVIVGFPSRQKLEFIKPVVVAFVVMSTRHMIRKWG